MEQRRRLTVAAALVASATAASAQNPRLNEIYVSHLGPDEAEFIELTGLPGLPLDGVLVCVVEGDGAQAGVLDAAWDLTGHVIPPDGYFVLGDTGVQEKDYDLGQSNSLENGTQTVYLISAGNPASILALVGTDLDPDDDGVTVLASSSSFFDFLCIADAGYPFQDRAYDGAPAIGPDGAFLPAGVYRGGDDPDGWCGGSFLDFDLQANAQQPRTPGAPNSPCVAQVLTHKGLAHETLGLAGLAVDPDGAFRMTNLGSSGEDGVTIGTEGAASYAVSIENPYTGPTPTLGGQVADVDIETLRTFGGQPVATLLLGLSYFPGPVPISVPITLKFSQNGNGFCTVKVYSGPILINTYTIPCPGDELIDFATLPPAPHYIVRPDYLFASDELRASIELPQVGPISVFGQPPVQGDRLVVAISGLPPIPGALTSTTIRASHAGGSLRLLDERVVIFGHDHTGLGQSALEPDVDAGTLRVSGLGPNADYGVQVRLDEGDGIDVELQPVDVLGINNAVLTAGAFGVYQGAPTPLGTAELFGMGQSGELHADFSALGTNLVEIVVLAGGVEQGRLTVPAGLVALFAPSSGGPIPSLTSCGKLPGDIVIPAPPCYVFRFAGPLAVTPQGGQTLVGEELLVLAANAPGVVESLGSFSLEASGVPELVLLAEDALGDCDLERTCVAVENSTGPGARLELAGGCEIGADVLELFASPVPNQPGIFFLGTTSIQVPFGDGFRCVGGSTKRLPATLASGNILSTQISLVSQPSGLALLPGDVRGIQAWYRDPAAGGANFNLSDAVFVTFR